MSNKLEFFFFSLVLLLLVLNYEVKSQNILFLPLDERFTTRNAFLNLARTTPFQIQTPPTSLLPQQRHLPNMTALENWVSERVSSVDHFLISSEMFLYGGLIASRISNDTEAQIQTRLNILLNYKKLNPKLKLYASSVVMRIPAYNEDVEEPWYWAYWGYDLYEYSYYTDKYNQLHNPDDLKKAQEAEAKVPPAIVQTFVWRRQRNFNITVSTLKSLAKDPTLFERFYITLDDNAEYGFNIAEARQLKDLVHRLGLQDKVNIYPGADEVGLTMLSRLAVDSSAKVPNLYLVFRDPNTVNYIPNYEGQPMILTLQQQIHAAGGTIMSNTSDPKTADVILLVNNFSEKQQQEAPNQPLNRTIAEYACFTPYLQLNRVVGFADNRYSNGADIILIEYLKNEVIQSYLKMENFAYAGWNTDGNTLGTVISNSILLYLFQKQKENTFFNSLRLLEDCFYQAIFRQELEYYVEQVNTDSVNNLSNDLAFYEKFSFKVLNTYMEAITGTFTLPWKLDKIYYPWKRCFEIGILAH